MKKIYTFITALSLFALAGCYGDDTSMPASEADFLSQITIENLEPQSAISNSTVLECTPVVKGFSDEELLYTWYIYGDNITENVEQGYRGNKIFEGKALSYPVKLSSGSYTIVLEVMHKEYGYASIAEMKLQVNTAYSQGFYILKETNDGNTNIDIYSEATDIFLSDILEEPLKGKPGYIDNAYNKSFIHPVTAKPLSFKNTVMITAGTNDFAMYNSEDMVKIFDRSSILFEEMEPDEVPYRIGTSYYGNFFFTSKGVHNGGSGSTGKFSYPTDGASSASPFFQAADGAGFTFWNEKDHCLQYNNGYSSSVIEYIGTDIQFANVECIATGWNHLAGVNTMWYMFEENGTKARYLVFLSTSNQITEVRKIDASSHLAQAEIIEGNTVSAASIYAVHNGKVYSYSLDDGVETDAFTIQGIGAGEQIAYFRDTYVSHYNSVYDFNHIIIGTQNGNAYKLYFYDIQGGKPYGNPVYTLTGEGKVKEVIYVCQTWFDIPNYYAFTNYAQLYGFKPNFPYN